MLRTSFVRFEDEKMGIWGTIIVGEERKVGRDVAKRRFLVAVQGAVFEDDEDLFCRYG